MTDSTFEVSELKQWSYCPRVVYYTYCWPDIRPITRGMEAGIRQHRAENEREERRSLRAYGLSAGERFFEVEVRNEVIGLRGQIDLVIVQPSREHPQEAIVVDYKDSEQAAGSHFKAQLAAYALLIEAAWQVRVSRGFIYSIPLRKAEPIAITSRLRTTVQSTIAAMRRSVEGEAMPEAPAQRGRCMSCEFRRFCNDVV